MVFQDLGDFSTSQENNNSRIAPAIDRFMAFVFDVALFSPIVSLLLSSLFKKIELRYYTAPGSLEFIAFLVLGFFATLALTVFTQTFCLMFWGATPGKYFFKLRVISLSEKADGKIQFLQAFLRSSLWAVEFICLWIPYFEIFSHKDRRPIHDRASETMVVTLKNQGDLGPHPLEAHFVRNMFFILIAVGFLWATLFASQVYRMAAGGEFKKSELEEEQLLCSGVTRYAENGISRQDVALARYIASEVDEECLLNEADFALWTGDSLQQAWGYLAKSIYYQFDSEKSNSYLEKVCEQESASEPCRLARALENEDRKEILRPSTSLTAKILQIRELSGRGEFTQALHGISDITASVSAGAFEKYAQKQTVKYLWILGHRDQSMGAYMNTWQFMDHQDQTELAAWMCLEETDDHCDNRSYKSCENLRDSLKDASLSHVSAEVVVGLVKEAECKKTQEAPLLMFHAELEENPALSRLVAALSTTSEWTAEHRLEVLRDLSFSKDPSITRVVQKHARLELVSKTHLVQDLLKAQQALSATDRHDWAWQKMTKKISSIAEQQNNRSWTGPLISELRKEKPQLKSDGSQRLPASASEEAGP
jgi:uncharacterized RDD family membrane protein YckC